MNELLQNLLQSGLSSDVVSKMSERSGLDSDSISSVISKVAPTLFQKANENFKSDNDSSSLIDMISKANLDEVKKGELDVDAGKQMLGELTGSKEESLSLANKVGESLGIDSSSIAKLLPMIAPLALGSLNKQVGGGNLSNMKDTNSLTSMLTNFLDKDNDGSVVDDLMGMAKKFF